MAVPGGPGADNNYGTGGNFIQDVSTDAKRFCEPSHAFPVPTVYGQF